MFSPNPSADNCHQTYTQFDSGLPPIPLFSPLIPGLPYMLDIFQWHQENDLKDSNTNYNPSTPLQRIFSSDPNSHEHVDVILDRNGTNTNDDDNTASYPMSPELVTELSTQENSSRDQTFTAPQDNVLGFASTCPESSSAVVYFPPLHDVGAFHAHAPTVEVIAPAMQRGFSHRGEVMGMAEIDSENCDATTTFDLEFLSFSPLFSSQHDNPLLSPSWNLELTLSSSWHLAAESAISLSHPIAQRSSLVRRPATRRKGISGPNSPKMPTRNPPYMNRSRTLIDLDQKRTPVTESGILRTTNSPMLKSYGYRVRFEQVEIR